MIFTLVNLILIIFIFIEFNKYNNKLLTKNQKTMRKLFNVSLVLAMAALTLTSCNCFNKMMKKAAKGISITATPEIVTLKGDNAITTLNVTFPAKAFHQQAVLKVTPVLVYPGGEVAGEPMFLQGDKVKENYQVISHKNGGSYTQELSFPYNPNMRLAVLVLRAEAKCMKGSKKVKNFTKFPTDIVVADGVNSLQTLANNYAMVAIAPDAFKRTTEINQSAKIMFDINSAKVRNNQLNAEDVNALEQFIKDNSGDPKKTVGNVYTQAYASPDGPLKFNDELSKERGTSTQKAVANKFKKAKVEETFDVNAMGEDWEGFKELVQASNVPDKDLILQVLSMYSDPQVRDREIKNMTAAFKVLAEKILPELRRSKMNVNVVVEGLTDAELRDAVANNINSLSVEEMLFAATLYNDNATKAKIYKACADKYNDYRAWNNLGCVYAWEGNDKEANACFKKAGELNNSNPAVINNLGVVALAAGKKDEAAKFFAASTAPEAKYNKGLVELAKGNYAQAAKSLDGFNKALALMLNGDVAGAKSILAKINGNWRAEYLKSVIAAREGDVNTMVVSLQKAITLNPQALALAETEVNFLPYAAHVEVAKVVKIKNVKK